MIRAEINKKEVGHLKGPNLNKQKLMKAIICQVILVVGYLMILI